MNVWSARRIIASALKNHYGASYEHDICFVLRYCLGLSSCWDFHSEVSEDVIRRIVSDIERGVPIQYICGVEEFKGNLFKVFPGVFIPREETEDLVDIAVKVIPKNAHVLEIGTGTGVIGISILIERKDVVFSGVDINPVAVVNTVVNAKRLSVLERIDVYHKDIFQAGKLLKDVNFIVSNPPYLPQSDVYTIDSFTRQEPPRALFGGRNGVEFIHDLIDWLLRSGFQGGFLVEFDDTTIENLQGHTIFHRSSVKYYKDRFGKERFAFLWL